MDEIIGGSQEQGDAILINNPFGILIIPVRCMGWERKSNEAEKQDDKSSKEVKVEVIIVETL